MYLLCIHMYICTLYTYIKYIRWHVELALWFDIFIWYQIISLMLRKVPRYLNTVLARIL